jgi:hypothetical protein
MQRGEGAGGRDLENATFKDGAPQTWAPKRGRAVEVAIAGLDEARRESAAVEEGVEGMQGGEGAGGRDLEDGATPEGPAELGCAVEIAIAGLDKAGGLAALSAAGEGMQRGEGPVAVILKTVPSPVAPPPVVVP